MLPDTILDVDQVAEHLRCKPEQAETLMRDGKLPATKIGRGWITTYGEVVAFVIGRIRAERTKPEPVKARVVSDKRGPRALPELPAIR